MKLLRDYILVVITFCCFSFLGFKNRSFPQFEAQTIEGKLLSNVNFEGHKTLVVLGHIGCPAMMQLLKDLQESDLDYSYQTLVFLENTVVQVNSFNSQNVNDWSTTR